MSDQTTVSTEPEAKTSPEGERRTDTNTSTSTSTDDRVIQWVVRAVVIAAMAAGPVYVIWQRIPLPPLWKWIWLGGLVAAIVVAYIFFQARTVRLFEVVSNFLVVIAIVLGAALCAAVFAERDRSLLFRLFVVGYFSFLPSWLYLQFISVKGKTLWDEYVINLYRLHMDHYEFLPTPPRHSIFFARRHRMSSPALATEDPGAKSLYERKFEALFGSVGTGDNLVFRGENLFPVAIATLIVSIGWVLVVQPETIFGVALFPGAAPGGIVTIPLDALRFGFLGAYFYVLQMLVRRYFQNDLKTNAYVNATMRVIVVTLLIWVLDPLWEDQSPARRAAAAFVIGVFPYIGWQALQALVKLPMKLVVPSLRQQYPLSDLDGLNVWYESRLLEEGVEDMQNLATANLVDVMLNTRIPVERLVDWVDQSILYLHLGKDTGTGEGKRETLRRYGIRTATDLEDALAPLDSSGESSEDQKQQPARLARLLTADSGEPSALLSILATFKDEPNLYHVREWKSFPSRVLSQDPNTLTAPRAD